MTNGIIINFNKGDRMIDGYELENGTTYVMRKARAIYYIKTIEDAASVMTLVGDKQPYGKRGKKGKSNKDWDK
jgi:hypothetical protein